MTTPRTNSTKAMKRSKRTGGTDGPMQHAGPREQLTTDSERAQREALWASPAFQAALAEGRASFERDGGISGEELDRRLGITDADKLEAEAWLDEYERRLACEESEP